jgi:hypothetical protein
VQRNRPGRVDIRKDTHQTLLILEGEDDEEEEDA